MDADEIVIHRVKRNRGGVVLDLSTWRAGWGPEGVWDGSFVIRRGAATSAVKAAAKFGQDDLKSAGDQFDKNVLVAIVVCLTFRLRKFDAASHAAFWAF